MKVIPETSRVHYIWYLRFHCRKTITFSKMQRKITQSTLLFKVEHMWT